jgi:hypothetical protein
MTAPALRRARRACAVLAVVLGTAGTLAAAGPPPASAQQTAAVHAHLLWNRYDAADRERMLTDAKQAGAGMVRVDLGWSSLEQDGKGRYSEWYLRRMDHVVNAAQKRGIKVLFTFWETPCWASTAPPSVKQGCAGEWWGRDVQRYPPADARDFGAALAFVVARYGDRVAAWEIWNEPNHPDYFKASDKVSAYARLVKAAYPAAKAADPSATVIAGSLADSDFGFTEALLDKGVGGSFDAWSVHPYSEDRSPLHPGIAGWTKKSFARGVPAVRRTLLRHGQNKPLWLTEFGWSTCAVRGQAAYDNCVTPGTQAAFLQRAFRQMQAWDYVPVGTAFNLADTSKDPGSRLDNYGLTDENGGRKPAFGAFRAASAALRRGSVVPKRPAAKAKSKRRHLNLRVYRRNGRSYVVGRAPAGRVLRVKLHRWKLSVPRFSPKVAYDELIRVKPRRRFRHRISLRASRGGRWLVVAKVRRRPRLSARAVLR